MPTQRKIAAPRIPGEPIAEPMGAAPSPAAHNHPSPLAGEGTGERGNGLTEEEATVTMTQTQFAELMARFNALQQQVGALATPARAVAEAALPEQHEIDATRLKSPQLSKQGWVVPEFYGAHPAHKGV